MQHRRPEGRLIEPHRRAATVDPKLGLDGRHSRDAAPQGFHSPFEHLDHRRGKASDIVAQLGVGDAAFWIAATESGGERLVPRAVGGATGRLLLVVDDPDAVFAQAVAAGAQAKSAVGEEHGWRVGRVIDPFGHEWEIGKPLIGWPP